MQAQIQQVRERCQQVIAKAKILYPHIATLLGTVEIRFDLKGRSAGMAGRRGDRYIMRFNWDMLGREAFDHVYNDTVPHEIAHLVCFMDPRQGRNHDYGWAHVCRALGGSGARCHEEEVVYGKGYTYEYVTNLGHKVRMGDKHHQYVQRGGTLRYKHGKGVVVNTCAYSIVGHQGRTLANPVVRTPQQIAPVPATPVLPVPVQQPAPVVAPVVQRVLPPAAPAAAPVQRVLPPAAPAAAPVQRALPGESKAAVSRRIMLSGYQGGRTYEQIIAAMMAANGYDRQLARATFKANAARVGIPANWGG